MRNRNEMVMWYLVQLFVQLLLWIEMFKNGHGITKFKGTLTTIWFQSMKSIEVFGQEFDIDEIWIKYTFNFFNYFYL